MDVSSQSRQKRQRVKRSRHRGKRVLVTQVASDDEDSDEGHGLAAAEESQPDRIQARSQGDPAFRYKRLACAVICCVLGTAVLGTAVLSTAELSDPCLSTRWIDEL